MNHTIMFLDQDNKAKLVPVSYSQLLKLMREQEILAEKVW